MEKEHLRLELDVEPSVATISTMRHVVDELSCRLLGDADGGWRLSMAAYELLDNARKYGQDRVAHFCLDIEPLAEGHQATILVQNVADRDQAGSVQQLWSSMQQSTDAWAFYLATTAETAAATEGSGLGLARIWAEGGMELGVAVDEERRVTVRATLVVGGGR
jgi:hypothetical protein